MGTRGTPQEPLGLPLPPLPLSWMLKAPAWEHCLCLQQHWQPLLLLGWGLREEGLLREQMVPLAGFGGPALLAGRLGGIPFHRSPGGGLACLSHGQFPAERLYGIMLLFI